LLLFRHRLVLWLVRGAKANWPAAIRFCLRSSKANRSFMSIWARKPSPNRQQALHALIQDTYPEWAFTAYRSRALGQASLPSGPGATPTTGQQCHMSSVDSAGKPLLGKIASIEEYSNYSRAASAIGACSTPAPWKKSTA
jgi:hypothetical protein